MKSSESSADREREGIRLQIGGGRYDGEDQKAIVEFLCDAKKEDKISTAKNEEDHKYGNAVDDEHGGTIEILSWDDEDDAKVLRLEWNTPYACEDAKDGDSSSGGGWGFFTWFILMWVLLQTIQMNELTDNPLLQCFHGRRSVPHLRLLAQL